MIALAPVPSGPIQEYVPRPATTVRRKYANLSTNPGDNFVRKAAAEAANRLLVWARDDAPRASSEGSLRSEILDRVVVTRQCITEEV